MTLQTITCSRYGLAGVIMLTQKTYCALYHHLQ
jgi:hypothetical protein